MIFENRGTSSHLISAHPKVNQQRRHQKLAYGESILTSKILSTWRAKFSFKILTRTLIRCPNLLAGKKCNFLKNTFKTTLFKFPIKFQKNTEIYFEPENRHTGQILFLDYHLCCNQITPILQVHTLRLLHSFFTLLFIQIHYQTYLEILSFFKPINYKLSNTILVIFA